jgi:diguanylate cyclase (GGDEF)-like protein
VVLLPDTRGNEAVMAAEYLRMHVASHCRAGGEAVTVSIGVAEARPGDDADAWIRRADAALYRAKSEGRNRAIAA